MVSLALRKIWRRDLSRAAAFKLQEFRHDRRGTIVVLFAFMAVVLVGTGGGAVDYGRWLAARNNPEAFSVYQVTYQRRKEFVQLIVACRGRLEELYTRDLPVSQKRHSKSLVFEKLKDDYRLLKQQWGDYSGYDAWFDHELNNAQLVTVSIYYDLVPAFLNLLRKGGNDLPAFYEKCRKLAQKPRTERRAFLQKH